MRLVCARAAIAIGIVTAGMTAFAAAEQSAPARKGRDAGNAVTITGCVQREADYRHATGSGTGGVGGFGLGLGDEYVLINAVRAGSRAKSVARTGSTVNDIAAADSPCGKAGGKEAFELTGKQERELARLVGQRVEIVGVLKPGKDAPVGTSGTETRTDTTGLGKLNPFDQDLDLQEIEITSVRGSSR